MGPRSEGPNEEDWELHLAYQKDPGSGVSRGHCWERYWDLCSAASSVSPMGAHWGPCLESHSEPKMARPMVPETVLRYGLLWGPESAKYLARRWELVMVPERAFCWAALMVPARAQSSAPWRAPRCETHWGHHWALRLANLSEPEKAPPTAGLTAACLVLLLACCWAPCLAGMWDLCLVLHWGRPRKVR